MKQFFTIIFFTVTLVNFAQDEVEVNIQNLKANNVSVPSGSSINLGTESSVNVSFRVDLSKGSDEYIGPAFVAIEIHKSNGSSFT